MDSVKNTIAKMLNNRRMLTQRKNAFAEDQSAEKKEVKFQSSKLIFLETKKLRLLCFNIGSINDGRI